ncbi:MAG TPA: hypothetical protein VK181_12905 [Rhizobium sp.]|nr:hypothetical protein [Rhizobium sp.]
MVAQDGGQRIEGAGKDLRQHEVQGPFRNAAVSPVSRPLPRNQPASGKPPMFKPTYRSDTGNSCDCSGRKQEVARATFRK